MEPELGLAHLTPAELCSVLLPLYTGRAAPGAGVYKELIREALSRARRAERAEAACEALLRALSREPCFVRVTRSFTAETYAAWRQARRCAASRRPHPEVNQGPPEDEGRKAS